MFNAWRYRNQLVAIELSRRSAYRATLSQVGEVAAVEAAIAARQSELDEMLAQVKTARRSSSSRATTQTTVERAKHTRSQLRELRARARDVRGAVKGDPQIQTALRLIEEQALQEIKQARASAGVYWGTYLHVEAAAVAARRSKMDPKFRRWTGDGRVVVQVRGGATPYDIHYGHCQQLQIDPLPTEQWETRSGRRGAKTVVRIRIGSTEKREPIWAQFPMLLHRPLPSDSLVKGAAIVRRRIARAEVWSLQVTVESAIAGARETPDSALVAALHFGWRAVDDGLRVAVLADERGVIREFVLPRRMLDRLTHAETLQSVRDRNFETFRTVLRANLEALGELPEWIDPAILRTVHLWRSQEKCASLMVRWQQAYTTESRAWAERKRQRGLSEVLSLADEWRRKDLHLLQWQEHERIGALAFRKKLYEKIAAELGRTYSLVILEHFDLRSVARQPAPEKNERQAIAVRANRTRAAISQLRGLIRQRCNITFVAPGKYPCHTCGTVEQFDARRQLTHECGVCGTVWDQDVNAALHVLKRYRSGR